MEHIKIWALVSLLFVLSIALVIVFLLARNFRKQKEIKYREALIAKLSDTLDKNHKPEK
jgi:uncharacterized membrane protein